MDDNKQEEKESFCVDSDVPGEEAVAIADPEKRSRKSNVHLFETLLIVTGPVIMSLFLELVGPTLPDLMHRVNCRFEEIARALVARSAGHMVSALTGGIIANKMKGDAEAFLSLGFLLGAVGTVTAPWCRTLVALTAALLLQGLANGTMDTCKHNEKYVFLCLVQCVTAKLAKSPHRQDYREFINYLFFLFLHYSFGGLISNASCHGLTPECIVSTIICTRLWRQRAALPLHVLHFGYGVGGLIAPQLALPFIVKHVKGGITNKTSLLAAGSVTYETQDRDGAVLSLVVNLTEPEVAHDWATSRIEIPYAISGFLSAALGLALAVFYFSRRGLRCRKIERRRAKTDCQETKSCKACTSKCSQLQTLLYIACLFNMSFMLFTINGGLHGYAKFLYTFATEGDQAMSDKLAALLNTAFWLSFTGGRGASMVASRWVSPVAMLWAEVITNIVSGVALFVWGDSSQLVLWTSTCLFGFSIGPMIPSLFSCANLYVPLEGFAVALLFLNLAFGMMGYQYFAGYLFDIYGPKVLMTIVLFYCSTILLAMIIMSVVLRYKTNRFEEKLPAQITEEEIGKE